MALKLIVGLGNPGRRYVRTRHNVGFRVVERIAQRLGAALDKRRFEALYAAATGPQGRLLLVQPQTYMNESGRAVAHFVRYHKARPADVLVVCDDMALALGVLRIRARGSSGGQKGLESVLRALGTNEVARLRVGIGQRPPYMEGADYVLGRFSDDEQRVIEPAIERAAEAALVWAPSQKGLLAEAPHRHSAMIFCSSVSSFPSLTLTNCPSTSTSSGPFCFPVILTISLPPLMLIR